MEPQCNHRLERTYNASEAVNTDTKSLGKKKNNVILGYKPNQVDYSFLKNSTTYWKEHPHSFDKWGGQSSQGHLTLSDLETKMKDSQQNSCWNENIPGAIDSHLAKKYSHDNSKIAIFGNTINYQYSTIGNGDIIESTNLELRTNATVLVGEKKREKMKKKKRKKKKKKERIEEKQKNRAKHQTKEKSVPQRFYKNKQCKMCGEFGHRKKECPLNYSLKCDYCLGNHQKVNCLSKICMKCGELRHNSKKCIKKLRYRVKCNTCGKSGHRKKDCNRIYFGGTITSVERETVLCYNCQSFGHLCCKLNKKKLSEVIQEDKLYLPKKWKEFQDEHKEVYELNRKEKRNRKYTRNRLYFPDLEDFTFKSFMNYSNSQKKRKEVKQQKKKRIIEKSTGANKKRRIQRSLHFNSSKTKKKRRLQSKMKKRMRKVH